MKTKIFNNDLKKIVVAIFLIVIFTALTLNQVFAQAGWAKLGTDNKLVYKQDANGNRIMDFSYAGYMGGGVALPNVPVKVTVNAATNLPKGIFILKLINNNTSSLQKVFKQ